MTNNSFKSAVRIPKLTQPFTLQEIKNRPFAPALAPANPFLPVKPEIACFQNERKLKTFYNHMGQKYLLPAEIWSDKKIADAIKLLGKNLDILEKSRNLNKDSVQEAVNKILPNDAKGIIQIKDFKQLEEDLRRLGYSESIIKRNLNSCATTINYKNYSCLYIDFEKTDMCKSGVIEIKNNIEHEITHALTHKFQNTKTTDYFKNTIGICAGQNSIFSEMFNLFEHHYEAGVSFEQTELNKEGMLNWLGYNSIDELYQSFDSAIDVFTKQKKASGELEIENKNAKRQFYTYLKHRAKEEKTAYGSNIRFRELHNDPYTPTDAEFVPMLYEEMEKFFAKRENEIGKINS